MYKNSIVTKKLVVQPVFVSLVHLNVFMGPCRYGVGEELTYDYEKKESLKTFQFFNEDLKNYVDHGHVELLESKYLEWHEDFAVKEESIEDVLSNNEKVDVYLISGTRLISYVSTIIAKRSGKPIAFCPLSNSKYSRLGGIDAAAHLFASGDFEVYNALSYEELNQTFRAMRTRKVLKNMKLLYGLRNNTHWLCCAVHVFGKHGGRRAERVRRTAGHILLFAGGFHLPYRRHLAAAAALRHGGIPRHHDHLQPVHLHVKPDPHAALHTKTAP